jgi:hypothetical protein
VSRQEENQCILHTHALFEPHRLRHLETLFPTTSRTNLLSRTEVDCWTEDPTLLSNLFELLPFGQALLSDEYNNFIENTLPRIPSSVQDQFLYWYLANPPTSFNQPIESTLLWNNDINFWTRHIPPRLDDLTSHILDGEHIQYLEQFRLDYQEIRLNFQEIHLVTYGEERHTRPVITEGHEFTYRWNNPVWEITLENPDQNLVNPRIHHLPQDTLDDELNSTHVYTALAELNDLTLNDRQEHLLQEDLPPSSGWTSRAPVSDIGWEDDLSRNTESCWCNKEVCTCRYRPDTPPTPPSVVLWSPGLEYLPARE